MTTVMKMTRKLSVKVASWPYSNADTWLWCQKSLQDYLLKIRLNVEKTMNVKKILPLLQD